jgi:hypothetical protein
MCAPPHTLVCWRLTSRLRATPRQHLILRIATRSQRHGCLLPDSLFDLITLQSVRPGLQRVDQKQTNQHERPSPRFGIAIESVYYYREPEKNPRVCCAVMLAISFDLHEGENFGENISDSKLTPLLPINFDVMTAYAKVPLSTLTSSNIGVKAASGTVADEIDISGYYPSGEEHVKVDQKTGSKDTSIMPVVKVTSPVAGGELSGAGVNTHLLVDEKVTISLIGTDQKSEGHPTCVCWYVFLLS